MSDNRKYYYLKLKENFYNSETMVILESMQDGLLYPEPYIVKLSVLHAGGFENTIQDQRHDYGQYTFEEKCFDCFASCHR